MMTTQTTMHTASHWQALAADTAKRITGMRDSAITEAASRARRQCFLLCRTARSGDAVRSGVP
ncbi:MAG: hypothetical protein O6829_04880 [Alphaproteobacteria bacterium]|nr:hypothetical protein [Alphaproteobacteria bacterium]